jgi:hypothetical protein
MIENKDYVFFAMIKKEILDQEFNMETGEKRVVVSALGCNRFNHGIEITEEWYTGRTCTFAASLFSKVIGPCTCRYTKKESFFGVRKEE